MKRGKKAKAESRPVSFFLSLIVVVVLVSSDERPTWHDAMSHSPSPHPRLNIWGSKAESFFLEEMMESSPFFRFKKFEPSFREMKGKRKRTNVFCFSILFTSSYNLINLDISQATLNTVEILERNLKWHRQKRSTQKTSHCS